MGVGGITFCDSVLGGQGRSRDIMGGWGGSWMRVGASEHGGLRYVRPPGGLHTHEPRGVELQDACCWLCCSVAPSNVRVWRGMRWQVPHVRRCKGSAGVAASKEAWVRSRVGGHLLPQPPASVYAWLRRCSRLGH